MGVEALFLDGLPLMFWIFATSYFIASGLLQILQHFLGVAIHEERLKALDTFCKRDSIERQLNRTASKWASNLSNEMTCHHPWV